MDKFETQDIQLGHALTYKEFFKQFNETSDYYHALPSNRGGVDIVDEHNKLKASLLPHTDDWYFTESGFRCDELSLMAKLASVPPKFRGEI